MRWSWSTQEYLKRKNSWKNKNIIIKACSIVTFNTTIIKINGKQEKVKKIKKNILEKTGSLKKLFKIIIKVKKETYTFINC